MRCVLCGQVIGGDYALKELISLRPVWPPRTCQACLRQFAVIDQPNACPGCGRPDSVALCRDCRRWQAQGALLLHHQAVFAYNQALKDWVFRYKGLGDWAQHVAFQAALSAIMPKGVVVPLVSEPAHLEQRGFDPVIGLFGHLPLRYWLKKTATDRPQAQKTRRERLLTPQSFEVVAPTLVKKARRIVLVDDLYTTGRTLYHAAAALRAAGFAGELTSRSLIR